MKCAGSKQCVIFLISIYFIYNHALFSAEHRAVAGSAQFIDDFNDVAIAKDPRGINGWAFFTGDGKATMDFQQGDGYASILVDSTKDKRNIWWALIKRRVSADLDLNLLKKSGFELRIEARIRLSHAQGE